MTTLRLSRFTEVVDEADGQRAMLSRYTSHRVGLTDSLAHALPEILALDIDTPDPDGPTLLAQLCAYELASRGLLVPADLDEDAERQFLDSLEALVTAPSFFGVPTAALAAVAAPTIAFLGVPCDLGASYPGTSAGPSLLREASRRLISDHPGGIVVDAGQRPAFAGAVVDLGDVELRRRDLAAWMTTVEGIVAALPTGVVPVVIGGDHAFSYPVIKARYERRGRRPFTVVHIDHHRDLQTRGAFVVGAPRQLEPITHANVMSHVLALDPGMRLVQLGVAPYVSAASEPDAELARYLARVGEPLSALDLAMGGPLGIAMALDRVGRDHDVYLSIDVDVLAAPYLRATGYPAPLGLDPITLMHLITAIARQHRVIGVDLMEFGIALPQTGPTVGVEAGLLTQLLCHVVAVLGQQLTREP